MKPKQDGKATTSSAVRLTGRASLGVIKGAPGRVDAKHAKAVSTLPAPTGGSHGSEIIMFCEAMTLGLVPGYP